MVTPINVRSISYQFAQKANGTLRQMPTWSPTVSYRQWTMLRNHAYWPNLQMIFSNYVLDMDNNSVTLLRDIVTKTHKIKIQSHMDIKLNRELTHINTCPISMP